MSSKENNPPLLIATTNEGKLSDYRTLLQALPLKLISLDEVGENSPITINETGSSFTENAILKAEGYGQYYNLLTLADDSGLVIDYLNGQPGVFSKRFGNTDTDRIQKVLHRLNNIPPKERTAQFIAVIAIFNSQTQQLSTCEGKTLGQITNKPLGSRGFGYDPIFFSPQLKKTFAQANQKEKNSVSHRRQAAKEAINILQSQL